MVPDSKMVDVVTELFPNVHILVPWNLSAVPYLKCDWPRRFSQSKHAIRILYVILSDIQRKKPDHRSPETSSLFAKGILLYFQNLINGQITIWINYRQAFLIKRRLVELVLIAHLKISCVTMANIVQTHLSTSYDDFSLSISKQKSLPAKVPSLL